MSGVKTLGARAALALCLGLGACDSPGPGFAHIPARPVTVDGSSFAVRQRGEDVQAIRLNRERRAGVMTRGVQAMERTTGCRVRAGTLKGDPALMTARVLCPGG
ncbi:hypothetical protein Ga0609869_003420 [Rhodovulum iodosum]|uniref:Lipoprotein n=1 Tax=Rhodovulum iodosum TaxID=68291 RepID=A0ABV3XXH4_9RHOB|nr:hypothetical protein [Rhodovulum robiginosum]RSK38102.1 hypothetical protein EJA01_03030 [Rhodovulum robiginosum]